MSLTLGLGENRIRDMMHAFLSSPKKGVVLVSNYEGT